MGPGEFLNINFFTALFTLLNTVALFLVLKKFLFKPVMKMIHDRQQEIDDLYADANGAKNQARQLQSQYEEKLAAAADEAERTVKEAVARGRNAEADAIRDKAAADIDREKKKAMNDAKDEISVIALAIAGKVVGKELSSSEQSALVDQFIEELGDGV